jgi:hypothetical protein
MKTSKTKLAFEKSSIIELNDQKIKLIIGGTISVGPTKDCTLCINSSNGPGGTIIQQLQQA